jgi:hypothetical protein
MIQARHEVVVSLNGANALGPAFTDPQSANFNNGSIA